MNSGKRHDGTDWYQLVLGCQYDPKTATLYKEEVAFVDRDTYKALKVGAEITIK